MQCVTRANKIRVGAAALLTLFMAYYAVIAFYTHVHWIDGVAQVHAHPFSCQHTHSSGEAFVYINSVMLPLFYRMEIYPISLISLYFILYFIV